MVKPTVKTRQFELDIIFGVSNLTILIKTEGLPLKAIVINQFYLRLIVETTICGPVGENSGRRVGAVKFGYSMVRDRLEDGGTLTVFCNDYVIAGEGRRPSQAIRVAALA